MATQLVMKKLNKQQCGAIVLVLRMSGMVI